MKSAKIVLTIILLVGIVGMCSQLPPSPLGAKITEGIVKYREKVKHKCQEVFNVQF